MFNQILLSWKFELPHPLVSFSSNSLLDWEAGTDKWMNDLNSWSMDKDEICICNVWYESHTVESFSATGTT